MGLAGVTASWQRQTRYFGHDKGDQYSVLIMDNRGMGASDKPLTRYSTSEMARDVAEVLDHVGWTAQPRQVHVVAISMGGMIAQELACLIPDKLRSLSLICTAGEVKNSTTYYEWIMEGVGYLYPKPQEQAVVDTARKIFVDEWLISADSEKPPSPTSTPGCLPAAGGGDGTYKLFDNNFQRFQAQELTKKRHPGYFTKQGFVCQLIAAAFHRKSPEQLKDMADRVGRERIMVMHGTSDKMIFLANGERLIEAVQPGTAIIAEGMGHAPIMERFQWFNETLEEKLKEWEALPV
jgi:pimeloyl-ACP methyl ester carboxylesterase